MFVYVDTQGIAKYLNTSTCHIKKNVLPSSLKRKSIGKKKVA